jgi:hypothetical protein
MNKSNLVIKIPNGSSEAHITMIDEAGITSYKTVVMDSLISNLTSSFVISTGLIPNNTRFFSGTTSDYMIGIESPARVRRFLQTSYNTRDDLPKELKIPFPTCLFIFSIEGSKIVESRVYAVNGPIHKENSLLYRFPFGNTYHNARICWGNAISKMSAINNPMSLVSVIALFYDAPFNGDLFDGQTINTPQDNKKVIDFWSMLVYLNGKETFPQEMLYNIKTQLSKVMREAND